MPEGEASDDTQFKKKTKIRGGHRTHLKKMFVNIAEVLGAYDPKDELKLLALRSTLQSKGDLLRKLDEEIMETITDDEKIAEEIDVSEEIQLSAKMKILEIDKFMERVKKASEERTKAEDFDRKPVVHEVEAQKRVKLPPMTIKDFTGDPRDFTSFKDQFMVAVERAENISDIEKFNYLTIAQLQKIL